MKYHRKSAVIEATRWSRNGDHPNDGDPRIEGGVVRYFRHPDYDGDAPHGQDGCERSWGEHGWIDTPEGGYTVCPGDWIITGANGVYPCKNSIFCETHELVV